MFYIINQNDQIIAADNHILELVHVESIDELTKEIILDNICFTSLTQESISISTPDDTLTYSIQISPLSSILGDFKLVQVLSVVEKEKSEEDVSSLYLQEEKQEEENTAIEEIISSKEVENDLISIKETVSISEEPQDKPQELADHSLDDTKDFALLDDIDTQETLTFDDKSYEIENKEVEAKDDELFDLTIPNAPEETIDEISFPQTDIDDEKVVLDIAQENVSIVQDTTPIIIYIDEVSERIGISSDDYTTFLNEYIDTAISLEPDLQSTEQSTRSAALETLTQLADVLELPSVNDIISQLDTLPAEKNKDTIESFYATLSRLTAEKKNVTTMATFAKKDPSLEAFNEEEPIHLEHPKVEPLNIPGSFGSINLDDVKPIHFDFQLEEAANDLSLPVELIEEFVHDFIEQAHVETKKMLTAYERGDLDAIQKIGHLLKGASSNLRINPLSDTLYQIQFCEDSSKLDALIKQYWGQFLAFEQQIDILSK